MNMIDTKKSTTAQHDNETKQVEKGAPNNRKERGKVWEIRRKVKTSHNRSSLFKFVFSEYRKIRDFGQETHILYPKLFPPGIQLNRDIHKPFTKYMQPLAIELYKALTYILKKRWSKLEKKEYNLLVILRRLCEKLALTNFNLLNYGDRNLIDRLRAIETYFLALYSDPGYPERIATTISRVLANDMQYRKQVKTLTASVKKILEKNIETPSLYNFLLGLNMLKYRRFLHLRDLITNNCGDLIGGETFKCEQEIQQEIDGFIEECKKNLAFLARKKSDIGRIRQYLPVDENGEVGHSMLQYLYESYESHDRYNFLTDQEDVVRFTARLLRLFRNYFGNLLCGRIGLFGLGTYFIFPQGYFKLEFDKFDTLIKQFDETSYDYTNPISLQQYLAMRSAQKKASKLESEVLMIVDDALGLFYNMGRKIVQILHEYPTDDENDEASQPTGTGLLTVPIETRISGKKSGFLGQSVGEVLLFVVNICFIVDHLFHGRYTYILLNKEVMIDREISTKLEMLRRVADDKRYQEIVQLCG
jgi:hypothetical protein